MCAHPHPVGPAHIFLIFTHLYHPSVPTSYWGIQYIFKYKNIPMAMTALALAGWCFTKRVHDTVWCNVVDNARAIDGIGWGIDRVDVVDSVFVSEQDSIYWSHTGRIHRSSFSFISLVSEVARSFDISWIGPTVCPYVLVPCTMLFLGELGNCLLCGRVVLMSTDK